MFCRYYSNCLNPKEAATKAGFNIKKSEKIAQKLLEKKEIRSLLKKLEFNFRKEKIANMAIVALKKIIFYRPNDLIKLIAKFPNLSEEEIEKFDLSQICEIKKLKDNTGFEFKFIDKIEAIKLLISLTEKIESGDETKNFLKAIAAKPA